MQLLAHKLPITITIYSTWNILFQNSLARRRTETYYKTTLACSAISRLHNTTDSHIEKKSKPKPKKTVETANPSTPLCQRHTPTLKEGPQASAVPPRYAGPGLNQI
jgi:hypothetical protein